MQPPSFENLGAGFARSLRRSPSAPALELGDESYSYERLWEIAGRLTGFLQRRGMPEPLIAILAQRNIVAYSSILGALLAGKGYVPLNPKFPVDRLVAMLAASRCQTLVVGSDCEELARSVIQRTTRPMTVICVDSNGQSFRREASCESVISKDDLPSASDPEPARVDPQDVAYLLFTSGSTGVPKGVPIRHSSVCAYTKYSVSRYGLGEGDRCSQTFDLTFDLSVHDMFVCWESGATLCPVPDKSVLMPAHFIRERKLTAWFSVPSVAAFLIRLRLLKPGAFPSLRWSLFCGEPLTATMASGWQAAASNSVLENLYGPTEATIAISQYRWEERSSTGECRNGIVPIGWIFEKQLCQVISSDGHAVAAGETGELCLSGSQVANGYWNDPERSAASFAPLPGRDGIWYRTGDLVQQDERGCLFYLSRKDHQVKISGFRVELQEIELVLRQAAQTEQAVAVPWPVGDPNPSGIVAVLSGAPTGNEKQIIVACQEKLPTYMVPRQIHYLVEFPLNANGKVDRGKIAKIIEN